MIVVSPIAMLEGKLAAAEARIAEQDAVLARVRDGLSIWEGSPQNYDMQECALMTIAEALAGAPAPIQTSPFRSVAEASAKPWDLAGAPAALEADDARKALQDASDALDALNPMRVCRRDLAAANARIAELEDLLQDANADLDAANSRADAAELVSAGRRVVLMQKADEVAIEWRRAERAEAEASALRAVIQKVMQDLAKAIS